MLLPARRASFQSERLEFRPLASQEGRLGLSREKAARRVKMKAKEILHFCRGLASWWLMARLSRPTQGTATVDKD